VGGSLSLRELSEEDLIGFSGAVLLAPVARHLTFWSLSEQDVKVADVEGKIAIRNVELSVEVESIETLLNPIMRPR
jgi:hypothetical protein